MRQWLMLVSFLMLTVIMAGVVQAQSPDDMYWDNRISSSLPGVDGSVLAMVVYDNKLIVGGKFSVAGGVIANNIAVWDGSSWSAIGTGTNDTVYALSLHDGKLVAGGSFTMAGGAPANRIAVWNGSSWSSLGSGLNGAVTTMAVWDAKLIAGGVFDSAGNYSANRVASWDGSSWSALGMGVSGNVRAITVYDSILLVGGEEIARWDGSSWSTVGLGVHGVVRALTIYNGKLIAAGDFTIEGDASRNLVASWNGSSWSHMRSSPLYENIGITALTTYEDELVASVSYNHSPFEPPDSTSIDAWRDSSWSSLVTNPGLVQVLAEWNGRLIAGQNGGISVWDGSAWSCFRSAPSEMSALATYDGKLLMALGYDGYADSIRVWDESSGSTQMPAYPLLSAITVYNQQVIMGHLGTHCRGQYFQDEIYGWNGSALSNLGFSEGGFTTGGVYALGVFRDSLLAYYRYVNHDCYMPGNPITKFGLTAWDGASWTPIVACDNSYWDSVPYFDLKSFAIYEDELVVGGIFDSIGGIEARNIASWDGASWSPLGAGIVGGVGAMAVYDGKLIVGGSFDTAGDLSAMNIAQWDGTSWSPLGAGIVGKVSAMTVYDGKLIVGGTFPAAGGLPAKNIAEWNGTSWQPLGSGLSGSVSSLCAYGDQLAVGGAFLTAGDKVAPYIALWTKHGLTDVHDELTEQFPMQFAVRQNYPNPFNPFTTIEYSVPTRTNVTVEIFNVLGQKVRTAVNEAKSAGSYRIEWNGNDDFGKPVSTGVYLYRFQAGDVVQTKKMLLLK